jgi:hypothetical protein
MRTLRPAYALDPHLFGRRRRRLVDDPSTPKVSISEDLRLFAASYALGLLFVSVLIF